MDNRLCITLLILAGLACPVWDDDRRDIIRVAGSHVTSVDIVENWALASWSDGKSGGMTLLHRGEGRWSRVTSGGGSLERSRH